MQVPYAKVGEGGVNYNGPPLADAAAGAMRIGIFGPDAEGVVARISPLLAPYQGRYSLIAVPSDVPWGKASTGLVNLIYDQEALGLIATDRNSSHLAEQLAAKSFVPLIAVTADRTLTSVNIPWVIRSPSPPIPRSRTRSPASSPRPRNRDRTAGACARSCLPRDRSIAFQAAMTPFMGAFCAGLVRLHGEHHLSRRQTGRRGADGDLAGPGSRAHHRHCPALVQLRLARGYGTAVGKIRVAHRR